MSDRKFDITGRCIVNSRCFALEWNVNFVIEIFLFIATVFGQRIVMIVNAIIQAFVSFKSREITEKLPE